MSSNIDIALNAKSKGNEFYKKRNFKDAITCYTKAIRYDPKASYYSNRSAAHFETGFYEGAVHDCLIAEQLAGSDDVLKSKIMLRRAKCLIFLGELEDAKIAIDCIPKFTPESNRVLTAILTRLEQKMYGYAPFETRLKQIPFEINPLKAMRTLPRKRVLLKPQSSHELYPRYDPLSLMEDLPEASCPDTTNLEYILKREQDNNPIQIALSGIGDGRMIFSTLTDFDMIMEKHEYEDKRTKTALEITIFEEDPAVIARNMIVFDCILSFCKVIVENREMTMDQLSQVESSIVSLQEATYLSHLFFGCKLPVTFADSLRDSLEKGIGKGMTQQEVLSWAFILPSDWLYVKMVMQKWANIDEPLSLEDVNIDVNLALKHGHGTEWLKACALRKQTATLNELREVSASKEYLETVYNDHKRHDKVPMDMDPIAYIQHLIEQVQDTPMELVEPQNWPLRGTMEERSVFLKSTKFTIPERIESVILSGEVEDGGDLEYEVNPTMTNPLDNMHPKHRLQGYMNPWEVAEQLLSEKLLMRDYAHSRATFNQPFVRKNADVNMSLPTFSEDMYHFWRLLSLRFHRCLVSRRVRLKFVLGNMSTHTRTSGNSIKNKIITFDRIVCPYMLNDETYFDFLTTSERVVRSKCLNGIYCIADQDKVNNYSDLRTLLQSQLSVSEELLTPTLIHLFKVRLVKGLLNKPHVFLPIQRPREHCHKKAFKSFYASHMKAYYVALEKGSRDTTRTYIDMRDNAFLGYGDADTGSSNEDGCDSGDDVDENCGEIFESKRVMSSKEEEEGGGEKYHQKKGGGGNSKKKKQKGKGKKGKKKKSSSASADNTSIEISCTNNISNNDNNNNSSETRTSPSSSSSGKSADTSLLSFADGFNSFCMPQHSYFTEPNTTAYLMQLLINCAFPNSANDFNNVAAWFHFVAKLCEENIIPKHWIALLIDQIVTPPNVVTTLACLEQSFISKASTTKKVCLKSIMSEFLALLRLWLDKIPCFDAFNYLCNESVVRAFFNFKDLSSLMGTMESTVPLGLLVFTSDARVMTETLETADLRSLLFYQALSPNRSQNESSKSTTTVTAASPLDSIERGVASGEMFEGPQLYSSLKLEGNIISCVMLLTEFERMAQFQGSVHGALVRTDTWRVLHLYGQPSPPTASYN
eukprot:m.21055 g.21055  ORF g.21055 m.21055 type:complete len:1154 (+) comp5321_c0_seq2:201-3662(+)